MAQEYYTFEQTLSKLQIDEETLRNLIMSGELRSFRDDADMKFQKTDVDAVVGVSANRQEAKVADEGDSFNAVLVLAIIILAILAAYFMM